jgi:hypothetical protein
MSRIMLTLGDFRFEMHTLAYEKLALSQSYRWPAQARITRDPALQYVGRETATIQLDGVLRPNSLIRGRLSHIETLRAMADQGKPYVLVDGIGRVWGKWVITDIKDDRSLFLDDGQSRVINFSVSLKSYGSDGDTLQAFGYGSPALSYVVGLAEKQTTNPVGLSAAAASTGSVSGLAKLVGKENATSITDAWKSFGAMRSRISDATNTVNQVYSQYGAAKNLMAQAQNISQTLQTLRNADGVINQLNTLNSASNQLDNLSSGITSRYDQITNMSIWG